MLQRCKVLLRSLEVDVVSYMQITVRTTHLTSDILQYQYSEVRMCSNVNTLKMSVFTLKGPLSVNTLDLSVFTLDGHPEKRPLTMCISRQILNPHVI